MKKGLIYVDRVSNAIDNAMQINLMQKIANELKNYGEIEIIDPNVIGKDAANKIILDQKYDYLLTYNKTATNLKKTNYPINFYSKKLKSSTSRG